VRGLELGKRRVDDIMDSKRFTGIFAPRTSLYLWIILVLVIAITFMHWQYAIPGYVLLGFLVFYNVRSGSKRRNEITKYIENLTLNIDTATKDTLLNFPMPLVVTDLDGTIIWYNSSFKKIFEGVELLEKTISTFVDDLHPNTLAGDNVNISKQVTINGMHYKILCNFAKIDKKSEIGDYILILYFIDNTEHVELKKKYQDEKVVVGLIVIDNYDDLMQSMEDALRPQMLAEIEKKVINWMGFTYGIIKKFERDKYLFVFENKFLKELEDKKFEILDSVKEINVGNRIPVTLSLGFGLNGKTIVENSYSAGAAIDIALGRGGDQVVIKNGDHFNFFGGRTRELEKRTKVKARVIACALRELIDQSSSVYIMGHENADVDSLGSSLGLYRVVKSRGKDVHIVLERSNPTIDTLVGKIQKNPDYDGLFVGRSEALLGINKKSLLIIVDTHRPGFTEVPELVTSMAQVVVIDHHRKGADFIQDTVLTYQETYASSTCELITEILQYIDEKFKLMPLEAEALYAGIVVDTKNFTFKTGVRTFEAASYLRRQGVDTVAVKQLFQNDLVTYTNISNVVRDAEMIGNEIAVSICQVNVKNSQLIAAKAADELLNLTGIVAAFVLCYVGSEVYISGRSLGDINVQMILEKLGGGGHLTVAGAQLQGITLEDARDKLKYAIMEYIKGLSNKE
jgi:Predicted signaling protein consisting of a modified GGDEF domain and a DHH domain